MNARRYLLRKCLQSITWIVTTPLDSSMGLGLSTTLFDLLVSSIHIVGRSLNVIVLKLGHQCPIIPLISRTSFYCSLAGFGRSWYPLLHTQSPQEPPKKSKRWKTKLILNPQKRKKVFLMPPNKLRLPRGQWRTFWCRTWQQGQGRHGASLAPRQQLPANTYVVTKSSTHNWIIHCYTFLCISLFIWPCTMYIVQWIRNFTVDSTTQIWENYIM